MTERAGTRVPARSVPACDDRGEDRGGTRGGQRARSTSSRFGCFRDSSARRASGSSDGGAAGPRAFRGPASFGASLQGRPVVGAFPVPDGAGGKGELRASFSSEKTKHRERFMPARRIFIYNRVKIVRLGKTRCQREGNRRKRERKRAAIRNRRRGSFPSSSFLCGFSAPSFPDGRERVEPSCRHALCRPASRRVRIRPGPSSRIPACRPSRCLRAGW